MSILAGVGKGKEIELDGVKIFVNSIEIDEESAKMMELNESTPISESFKVIKQMVKKMLKEAVPDATEEELNKCLRLKNLVPLTEVFYEVNGLTNIKETSPKEKLSQFIKAKEDARKQGKTKLS